MTLRAPEDKPKPTIRLSSKTSPTSPVSPEATPLGELAGQVVADIQQSFVNLGEPMIIEHATAKLTMAVLIVDPHTFGDDDRHEATLELTCEFVRKP